MYISRLVCVSACVCIQGTDRSDVWLHVPFMVCLALQGCVVDTKLSPPQAIISTGANNSTHSGLGGKCDTVARGHLDGTARAIKMRPSFTAGKFGIRTASGLNGSQRPDARIIRK